MMRQRTLIVVIIALALTGCSVSGQPDDGTTERRFPPTAEGTPLPAEGGLNRVMALTAGAMHTCVLLEAGTVQCWGENSFGQLGNGMTTAHATPVEVSRLRGVTALAAGANHTCALLATGTVQCWGENSFGQLGSETSTEFRATPAEVIRLREVTALAAGANHTCALLATGTVQCWGENAFGQLGDGTSGQLGDGTSEKFRTTPVEVVGLRGATALAAGRHHTCAVLETGTVVCWGGNAFGQLGDGTTTNRATPTEVVGLRGVTALAAGAMHTCALLETGTVQCWGMNLSRQLGDGTATNRATPTEVVGLRGVTVLAAGAMHTCALLETGTVQCWGNNAFGQLGNVTARTP
jgi:alpha-tubulin suppressor-like RCC1 family protein